MKPSWNHGFGQPSWAHGFSLPTWNGSVQKPKLAALVHPKVKHPKAAKKARHLRHLRTHTVRYRAANGRFAKRPKKA